MYTVLYTGLSVFRIYDAKIRTYICTLYKVMTFNIIRLICYNLQVQYHAYIQWRTEGGIWGFQPPPLPPKFRNFDKAAFDCKLSGKCLVFLFHHPN